MSIEQQFIEILIVLFALSFWPVYWWLETESHQYFCV